MSLLGDFNYAVCQNCFTKQELKGLNCLKCGYKLPNEVPFPPGISEERKARMMAVIAGVNKRPPIAGLASKTGPPRAKGGGGGGGGKDGSVLLSQSAPLLPLGGASASGGHRVGMMPSGPPPTGPGSPEGKRGDAPPRVQSAAAAEAGLGLADEGEGPAAALRSTSAQGGPRLPGIGSPGAAGKAKKSRTHADEAAAKQASSTR